MEWIKESNILDISTKIKDVKVSHTLGLEKFNGKAMYHIELKYNWFKNDDVTKRVKMKTARFFGESLEMLEKNILKYFKKESLINNITILN